MLPPCKFCGGNLWDRDQDNDLLCGLCGRLATVPKAQIRAKVARDRLAQLLHADQEALAKGETA